MSLSMSDASSRFFLQGLKGLKGVLAKAAAHAEARKIDPNALLQARLYPDMFTMTRQVQIACDLAKGAVARLAGLQPPAYEDNEASFADLEARVAKTVAFIESVAPAAVDGSEEREITFTRQGSAVTMTGQPYLFEIALPNFWFHVTTAYDILRHNGVELAKRDFLGA